METDRCNNAIPCTLVLYRGKELVASFGASGFIFKDTAEVTAFDDPAVEGITGEYFELS